MGTDPQCAVTVDEQATHLAVAGRIGVQVLCQVLLDGSGIGIEPVKPIPGAYPERAALVRFQRVYVIIGQRKRIIGCMHVMGHAASLRVECVQTGTTGSDPDHAIRIDKQGPDPIRCD